MTRYDYFVYENIDEYCFMPCESDFRFPQRLNYWDIREVFDHELINLAKKENCNLATLKECIDTIKRLRDKK